MGYVLCEQRGKCTTIASMLCAHSMHMFTIFICTRRRIDHEKMMCGRKYDHTPQTRSSVLISIFILVLFFISCYSSSSSSSSVFGFILFIQSDLISQSQPTLKLNGNRSFSGLKPFALVRMSRCLCGKQKLGVVQYRTGGHWIYMRVWIYMSCVYMCMHNTSRNGIAKKYIL